MGTSNAADVATCPKGVLDLVALFAEQRQAYTRQTYNETQVRREFIAPVLPQLATA